MESNGGDTSSFVPSARLRRNLRKGPGMAAEINTRHRRRVRSRVASHPTLQIAPSAILPFSTWMPWTPPLSSASMAARMTWTGGGSQGRFC